MHECSPPLRATRFGHKKESCVFNPSPSSLSPSFTRLLCSITAAYVDFSFSFLIILFYFTFYSYFMNFFLTSFTFSFSYLSSVISFLFLSTFPSIFSFCVYLFAFFLFTPSYLTFFYFTLYHSPLFLFSRKNFGNNVKLHFQTRNFVSNKL